MERYKTEILSVEGFLEERPDMEVHTDKTIQSAIYQVAGMLNAKTGGLIQKVWDYSVVDRTNNDIDNGFTQPDPNCVYFRTPEQLAFIKQAFVEQTQYNINLGNDYTQGGGSYSIGNVNSSYSKPINFDTFAPMVEYLLQQARVLDLQSFLNESSTIKNSGECISPELEYDCKCLTENYADKTYLKIYQPDADEGRIATINNAHIITFEPQENVFTDYYTKSEIDNQQEAQETKIDANTTLLNQVVDELKKFEPFVFVGTYNPAQTYSKSQVVEYNGVMYLSLQDNNNQPLTNTDYWIKFGADVDLTGYAKLDTNNDFNGYVKSYEFISETGCQVDSQYGVRFKHSDSLPPKDLLLNSNLQLEFDGKVLATNEYVENNFAPKLPKTISLAGKGGDIIISRLSDIQTTGNYLSQSHTNNYPDLPSGSNGSGYLVVISYGNNGTGGVVNQYWYPRDQYNKYFSRTYNNGVWESWATLTFDSSNYYNKSEINNKVDTINDEIDTIRNDLENQINENTNNINNINSTLDNVAKINESNTFTQQNTFTNSIKVQRSNIIFDNDNSAILNFDNNENLVFSYVCSNNELVDGSVVLYKQMKDYIANNIPQPQEINLIENVEVPIPEYFINGKQVYQQYITTNEQFTNIFNIADFIKMEGFAKKGNFYKGVPWFYNTNEIFAIDFAVNGGLLSNGFQTTGHKLVLTYTKR